MDSELAIVVVDRASASDRAELLNRLYEFNRERTGYRDDRDLACFVREDGGRLVAGIDGFTWGAYARVDALWVEEALRGRGIGRRLLEAAEREARARGCDTIVVSSHDFQAPGFYERLGYTVAGETTGTPRGHCEFLFQKRLGESG